MIRQGARRTTDSGQRVSLPARPGVRPRTGQLDTPGPAAGGAPEGPPDEARDGAPDTVPDTECPPGLACEWIAAPHRRYRNDAGEPDYGNHDKADRPGSLGIDYIVVHDVEGYWEGATRLVRDPGYVSWHYTLRSSDGRVAQHLRTKDVG
ncbi:hypothetical protein HOY81_26915, partial [Streptomyces sp. JJ36]|nr:hypothetical protein [Streptomyces sp. JJ36]